MLAQETFPVNGVHDERHALHAFTNARIYVSANEVLDNGTLLLQDGKVLSVGSTGSLPASAIEHDCSGKVIYPSFIDINSGLNVDKKAPKRQKQKTAKIAGNWNPAIQPQRQYKATFPLNEKKSKDWLESGFGLVNLHHRDGHHAWFIQSHFLGTIRTK